MSNPLLEIKNLKTYFYTDEGISNIGLKWPNDLMIAGKKASGILLESSADADGRLEWLIIGVGVNVGVFPAASLDRKVYRQGVDTMLCETRLATGSDHMNLSSKVAHPATVSAFRFVSKGHDDKASSAATPASPSATTASRQSRSITTRAMRSQ